MEHATGHGAFVPSHCRRSAYGTVLHLYFSSMQVLPGQSVAMCSYIDPVSSLLIAAIALGERMSIIQCAGALLILGGAAFGEIYGKKEKKNQDK